MQLYSIEKKIRGFGRMNFLGLDSNFKMKIWEEGILGDLKRFNLLILLTTPLLKDCLYKRGLWLFRPRPNN